MRRYLPPYSMGVIGAAPIVISIMSPFLKKIGINNCGINDLEEVGHLNPSTDLLTKVISAILICNINAVYLIIILINMLRN
jgi:hypothetical protein